MGRAFPAAVAALVVVAGWWAIGMLATDAARYVGEPIVVERPTSPPPSTVPTPTRRPAVDLTPSQQAASPAPRLADDGADEPDGPVDDGADDGADDSGDDAGGPADDEDDEGTSGAGAPGDDGADDEPGGADDDDAADDPDDGDLGDGDGDDADD